MQKAHIRRKKPLYNVTTRIISAIVKIKREQDSLVPSNRIQVNAWCTNWVIYVLVIFYDFVNSARRVGLWRGVYTVPFLLVREVFVFFYVKKIIINKNVTSINVKNFTNDLYIIKIAKYFRLGWCKTSGIACIWCIVTIITNTAIKCNHIFP